MSKEPGEANMKGYYEGDGPGLPHGDSVTPILDAVIVFSLKKQAQAQVNFDLLPCITLKRPRLKKVQNKDKRVVA